MTLSNQPIRYRYLGNGTTDIFAFPSRLFDEEDIVAQLVDRATNEVIETLTLTTDYTVTIAENGTASIQVESGKIPANDEDILLFRQSPLIQPLALPTGTVFPARDVETELDRAVAILQEHDDRLNRAATLGETAAEGVSIVLPNIVAGRALKWNATEDGLVNSDNDPDTVVADATAAAATATIQAGIATTQAGIATTQAGIATGFAQDAEDSAALAESWAIDPIGDRPEGSAKYWAEQAFSAQAVNVKSFGAVGDGVTDDTTSINAAITSALSNGSTIQWPVGTYLVTGNLQDFMSARHIGSGVISSGGNSYRIRPEMAEKNTIHVSAAGDNQNDGLSVENPVRNISTVIAFFNLQQPALLDGEWEIRLLAGEYSGVLFTETSSLSWPVSSNHITIVGDYEGEYPDITHHTKCAGTSDQTAIYVPNGDGKRAKIYGIEFEGYRSAITWWKGGSYQFRYNNVKDMDFPFWSQGAVDVDARFNIFEDCARAGSIGYSSRGSVYNNKVINCDVGVHVTRSSIAHVDYIDFDGVSEAVVCDLNSRVSTNFNVYRNTNIAHNPSSGGIISDDECDYGTIGVDTKQVYSIDGSGESLRYNSYDGSRDHVARVWAYSPISIPPSSTSYVQTNGPSVSENLLQIPAGYFVSKRRKARLNVFGSVILRDNTVFRVTVGNETIGYTDIDLILPNSDNTSRGFRLAMDVFSGEAGYEDSFGRQYPFTTLYYNGEVIINGLPPIVISGTIAGLSQLNSDLNIRFAPRTDTGAVIIRRIEGIVR